MKPKINNLPAKHSQSSGSGPHGKTKKAERLKDKLKLKKYLKEISDETSKK